MIKSKRKKWLVALLVISFIGAGFTYREFYPPVPAWIKVPPGSSVLVSRRFHSYMWGPQYYCRIHSPLPAWQTASYMRTYSQSPNQELVERNDEYSQREIWANGWGLNRSDKFISVGVEPAEIRDTGTEVSLAVRIWPEQTGSTVEFYHVTSF